MTGKFEDLSAEQQEIFFAIQEKMEKLSPFTNNIDSSENFDNAKLLVIDEIFNLFKSKFERIKDSERYKSTFLSVVRYKQDEMLLDEKYKGLLYELEQLDGRADKNMHYFEALVDYCKNNHKEVLEIAQYIAIIKSFLSVYHKIISSKLENETVDPNGHKLIISRYAIQELTPLITGDAAPPKRSGRKLVKLFNKHGYRDVYDEQGLPDIGKKDQQRPSRTEYVNNRMQELSGKPELCQILNQILLEAEYQEQMATAMREALNDEAISVALTSDNTYIVEGGTVVNRKPVENEAHFQEIQNRILRALAGAKVSIRVAMAWFTNVLLRDKLIEMLGQGIDVYVAIYDDGINKKHGVDLSGIPHKFIRGTKGGIMHNKFCIIDNQVVLTGSYNWSTNAEMRNDENITISNDPEQATKYSVKFRELIS